MGLPGASELLIIFGALVLLFGGSKLPKLGGAIGESIRNFKKGLAGGEEDNKEDAENTDKKIESPTDKQNKSQ